MYAILLGPSAHQAQHLPVLPGGCPVSQADQVIVALLLGTFLLVGQGVEPGPRPHAGAASRLTLPFLHPVHQEYFPSRVAWYHLSPVSLFCICTLLQSCLWYWIYNFQQSSMHQVLVRVDNVTPLMPSYCPSQPGWPCCPFLGWNCSHLICKAAARQDGSTAGAGAVGAILAAACPNPC